MCVCQSLYQFHLKIKMDKSTIVCIENWKECKYYNRRKNTSRPNSTLFLLILDSLLNFKSEFYLDSYFWYLVLYFSSPISSLTTCEFLNCQWSMEKRLSYKIHTVSFSGYDHTINWQLNIDSLSEKLTK